MKSQGYALIEVVISLTVIIVLVTGLIAASTSALKASQFAKEKSLSVRYAQEGIEIVRNIRDTVAWSSFTDYINGPQPKSLGSNGQLGGSCTSNFFNISAFYARCVYFSWVDQPNNVVGVAVNVYWYDGGKQYSTSVTTYFTKWK